MRQAKSGSFPAAKWVSEAGWDKRPAGRPSKAELEKRAAIAEKIEDEYTADIVNMRNYK